MSKPNSNTEATDASDPMDEMVDEMCQLIEKGQPLHVEEFVARFPHNASEIREVAASLRQLAIPKAKVGDEQVAYFATEEQPEHEREFLRLVGTSIGQYRIREAISEGGFGYVYVAEQVAPVKRKVALKVIKPGLNSREIVARFEAERQALALMEHPNVARVIDGGSTRDGRPYFVMELVPGTQITEFCQNQKLDIRTRLELFRDVCRAIQHAHLKGIIHRDLKPSNVLVTMRDDRPVAKVIDFGVAKALHQRLTDKSVYTALGQLVGTPLYMSPEQIQLNELDVDTRSDIYALGVLLYELITGSTPFSREALQEQGIDAYRRLVCDSEPPQPSHRLSTVNKTRAVQKDQRQLQFQEVRLVRGELDWIVMKALETDRRRRYQSADAFANDIERFLAGEAVEACPPSKAYRLQKALKKHRVALTAAGMVFVSLLAGIAGTAYQAYRARDEANRAQQAENLASLRAEDAVQNLGLAVGAVDALLAEVADSRMRDVPEALPTAVKIMEDAVDFYNKLVSKSPENLHLQRKLLFARASLAQLDIDAGNVGRASQTYRYILPKLEQLYAKQATVDFAAQLAIVYLDAATEFGEHAQKHDWMKRPREICAEHDFAYSSDPHHRLTFVQANLRFQKSAPRAAVLDALHRSKGVFEKLPKAFWQGRQKGNGSIRSPIIALGSRLVRSGEQAEGMRWLRRGFEELNIRLPETRDFEARRAEIYGLFEDLVEVSSLAKGKAPQLFDASFRRANQVGNRLVSRFPHVLRYEWMFETFRGAAASSTGDLAEALDFLARRTGEELPVPNVSGCAELVTYTFFSVPDSRSSILQSVKAVQTNEIGTAAVKAAIARLVHQGCKGRNDIAQQIHEISLANSIQFPESLESRANLAASYALRGSTNRALALFDELLLDASREDPHSTNHVAWNCVVYYGDLVEPGHMSTMLDKMQEVVRENPGVYEYQNTLGGLLLRQGELEAARNVLERAIRIHADGGSPVDWILLAMVHHQLGDHQKACDYFQKCRFEIENWVEIRADARILFEEACASIQGTRKPG